MILVDKGNPISLKFGRNRDLDSITISATKKICSENVESSEYIDIRDGQVLESECTKFKALVLSSYEDQTTNTFESIMWNISMIISKYG